MSLRSILLSSAVLPLFAQSTMPPPPPHETQPIYRVNVVERSTPALNYGHLTEPTKIDFRGTVLLPEARGDATVDAKRGAVLVNAHFDHVPPPTRFGAEYLTYVVWAISPEGRAQNLGELVLNGSDKGKLTATTGIQAFALIVTAEPYFSVAQPSDVVVMENRVRPDTVAKVEQVNATYELLPRHEFRYTVNSAGGPAPGQGGRQVSMAEYEALVARYQAQSAIQTALVAGAQQYAPDRIARAQELLQSAQRISAKDMSKDAVATAREATQIAEDARVISLRRAGEERGMQARAHDEELSREARQERAAADLANERASLAAERAQLEREKAAMANERQQMAFATPPPPPPQSSTADRLRMPQATEDPAARSARASLIASLRASFETLDTPRGVVMVIPDSLLESAAGVERVQMRLAGVRSDLTAIPGLHFDVQGYTDAGTRDGYAVSQALAERVREMVIAEGVPAAAVTSHGFGADRPMASNRTNVGREENRRVEVVITGPAIGGSATWDRAYSIQR